MKTLMLMLLLTTGALAANGQDSLTFGGAFIKLDDKFFVLTDTAYVLSTDDSHAVQADTILIVRCGWGNDHVYGTFWHQPTTVTTWPDGRKYERKIVLWLWNTQNMLR